MSNNKQSSVEWLIDKIRESEIECHNYLEILHFMEHEGFFEKAKSIHREEIKKAQVVAFIDGLETSNINYTPLYDSWEDYYIKTFGENN